MGRKGGRDAMRERTSAVAAHRSTRLGVLFLAVASGAGLCALCVGAAMWGLDALHEAPKTAPSRAFPGYRNERKGRPDLSRTENLQAKVERLCASCHLMPTPDLEPRQLWRAKIEQMYNRYIHGARPIPEDRVLPIEEVIEYWTVRAPEYLPVPADALASPPSPVAFNRRVVGLAAIPSSPAVSCVRIVRWTDDSAPQLLISDLRHGVVVLWAPTEPASSARVIAQVPHPSQATVVDLDQDGQKDVLVANMGVFGPEDTTNGSVVWLRNRGGEEFELHELRRGLGRVHEVQAADFDEDGRLDVLVAEFGNLTTGSLTLLENRTIDWSEPRFDSVVLEHGPGTLNIPLVDLDGDGRLDFVMVQAQERERITAFLNRRWGSFRQESLYTAPHPRWGSVTIRLADMLGTGRTDVLFAHGDALENPAVIRPYHGVSWLENAGTFPFTYHRLTHFPGAHTAIPVDLDHDGRLDVVSSAFIPAVHPRSQDAAMLDSLIWLRQTAPGAFERFAIESGTPFHPCGEVGDINGDGAWDIVLGNFIYFGLEDVDWNICLTIYEGQPNQDGS